MIPGRVRVNLPAAPLAVHQTIEKLFKERWMHARMHIRQYITLVELLSVTATRKAGGQMHSGRLPPVDDGRCMGSLFVSNRAPT
jgi:hypothetical protein